MIYELNRLTEYSDQEIFTEIKRVAYLTKEKPLSTSTFKKHAKVGITTVRRRYGSFKEGLIKAGLDQSYINSQNRRITKEDVVEDLKKVSHIIGKTSFSEKEYQENGKFSKHVFHRHCGSFNKIMFEINFTVPLTSKRYTDEERFENLLAVWTYYGRQPFLKEMNKEPSTIGSKAYTNRWSSWGKSLKAFIEEVNKDNDSQIQEILQTNELETGNIKRSTKADSIRENRSIPLGLRWDILTRDKYFCVNCGRTPKLHNVVLEVDHIIPWSKGGRTVRDNLQTLCNLCNRGKSNKMY